MSSCQVLAGMLLDPEASIPDILTAMEQHASVAAVQEQGCGALYKLALENAENQVTIANLFARMEI